MAGKLHSYVVARDYGFAPNPFFGLCTLATCKPRIRSVAAVGDWVLGTGSAEHGRAGHIVYVMKVTAVATFNEYWNKTAYRRKIPNLRGSKKQAYGDNIYHRDKGSWYQADSHHSLENGAPNIHNIVHDTQVDRVLVSDDFSYWGKSGPEIPKSFRNFSGYDICARRNHKNRFPEEMVVSFLSWYQSLHQKGFLGEPLDW